MRLSLFALSLFFAFSIAHGKEYGIHDPKQMLTVSESATGKKYGIDLPYLDQMLTDLALHAKNFPPQFDSDQEKQRAVKDIKTLSGMLDVMVAGPNPPPELLWRAGFLNSMGHNLDIPGSAEKTSAIFLKLLAASPSDPRGNYMYGVFLAVSGKPKESIPYLEKATALGVVDATYSLGVAYLSLGDPEKALVNLDIYQKQRPNDENVIKLIGAIRKGINKAGKSTPGQTKDFWLSTFKPMEVQAQCNKSPLRKNFSGKDEECLAKVNEIFDQCVTKVENVKIPSLITSGKEAGKYGSIIGECITAYYFGGEHLKLFNLSQQIVNGQ